jgi:hypothetical protein
MVGLGVTLNGMTASLIMTVPTVSSSGPVLRTYSSMLLLRSVYLSISRFSTGTGDSKLSPPPVERKSTITPARRMMGMRRRTRV